MRTIDQIFNDRTCYKFLDKPIDETLLVKIYDIMKLGPTSANSCPLRIIFVKSEEAKNKLCSCVMEGNVAKIKSAPIVAIFAYDKKFYDKMDVLNPPMPQFKSYFSAEAVALDTATRNSTLQAAYFMMIARGFGLDCGPMSGFDSDAINKSFFDNTELVVNFICNLGYKDGENPYPKLPRLDFKDCCSII